MESLLKYLRFLCNAEGMPHNVVRVAFPSAVDLEGVPYKYRFGEALHVLQPDQKTRVNGRTRIPPVINDHRAGEKRMQLLSGVRCPFEMFDRQ